VAISSSLFGVWTLEASQLDAFGAHPPPSPASGTKINRSRETYLVRQPLRASPLFCRFLDFLPALLAGLGKELVPQTGALHEGDHPHRSHLDEVLQLSPSEASRGANGRASAVSFVAGVTISGG
jgi:hypothetical protein